jgi:hypothetical protein
MYSRRGYCSFFQVLPASLVDPRCERDTDPEVGQTLRLDRDELAGARVASLVRPVAPDLECPEPANFNFFTSAHGLFYAIENGVEQ